jgi:hypothetical protein
MAIFAIDEYPKKFFSEYLRLFVALRALFVYHNLDRRILLSIVAACSRAGGAYTMSLQGSLIGRSFSYFFDSPAGTG